MTPWLQDPDVTLYHGDNLDVLRALPDKSVHMCATSPPFYGLRDYGTGEWEGGDPDCDHRQAPGGVHNKGRDRAASGGTFHDAPTIKPDLGIPYAATCGKCGARRVDQQIGLEDTPDQWVERLVQVFREVRRVLRDDGTLWVEIGDSYAGTGAVPGEGWQGHGGDVGSTASWAKGAGKGIGKKRHHPPGGCKPKDLFGQPWLLAFALRADGWYLRSEIIWARPNPMPESVTDRPTKSHSTVFLLSKQPRYFYDADAIREAYSPHSDFGNAIPTEPMPSTVGDAVNDRRIHARLGNGSVGGNHSGANARSVWTIPTQPTPFAHFATWPEALVRRMILAGTSERGCCPQCGAPWTRDTTSEFIKLATRSEGRKRGASAPADVADINGRGEMGRNVVTTVGWSPSCDCKPSGSDGLDHPGVWEFTHPPVPCTVLDPFAGSATTMLVARNHGRHSIGIELNADYLKIAAKRLQQLSLLGGAL